MSTTQTLGEDLARLSHRVSTFVELTKPRLVAMILITTSAGFYLASSDSLNWVQLAATFIGTGLSAAGVLALNQYIERDLDARMVRTCNRPLPDRRVEPMTALFFGVSLTVGGLAFTAFRVNPLSALVIAAIVVTYLFVYTPLKQKSPLCTVAGAVPGALPPQSILKRGRFSQFFSSGSFPTHCRLRSSTATNTLRRGSVCFRLSTPMARARDDR